MCGFRGFPQMTILTISFGLLHDYFMAKSTSKRSVTTPVEQSNSLHQISPETLMKHVNFSLQMS